jgi:hypothetical protein
MLCAFNRGSAENGNVESAKRNRDSVGHEDGATESQAYVQAFCGISTSALQVVFEF